MRKLQTLLPKTLGVDTELERRIKQEKKKSLIWQAQIPRDAMTNVAKMRANWQTKLCIGRAKQSVNSRAWIRALENYKKGTRTKKKMMNSTF